MGIFNWGKRSKRKLEPYDSGSHLYKTFPAYQVVGWPGVQKHRRTLERIAQRVQNGRKLESIEQYQDGQYDFSFNPPDFQAACEGDVNAGMTYHREVADGKYWISKHGFQQR
ncbi:MULTISPECIES: hypothetical protein [unclassified Glutamicibacter]|uniref:hypothetical protein n=1 Tax=unclassified Glutamicibacter TaxID=2627139 RepID=UPI00380D31E9